MRVQLPKIGLGCMGFTHAYGEPMEEKLAVERIRAAYEMGYRFFDTAQRYTGIDQNGQIVYNETVVGEALKDVRQDVIIATKCGITMRDGQRIVDGRPETIRATLQESLKRLQTDYVDIYYLHTPDPKVPMAVVAKTMKELYDKGLIRGWGVSQVNAEQLREANAVFEVSAVQNRYSMMARAQSAEVLETAAELQIPFIAFSPLANGYLSGAYKASDTFLEQGDFRARMPQFTEEGFKASQDLLGYLEKLALDKQATQAQIALAWMENLPQRVIPIPGSRQLSSLKENFESTKIQLSEAEVQTINDTLDQMALGPVFLGSQNQR